MTQSDSIVNLDRGALHVDKDYNILGSSIMQMIRYEDRVYVGGNFATASSLNHSSMLCAGRMEIMGDFDQSRDPNSFTSSELFTVAFLGSGTHKAHFMEDRDPYFANVDPDYNDVEYVSDSISVTTAAIHIGIGMTEGLAEVYLDPTMVAIVGIFMAFYGISTVVMPASALLKLAEFAALALTVLSVYSMLKAGDELGDALNGDYSQEERAEQFGKAAVMMILGVVGLYGSMNAMLQPKMLRSIVEASKNGIGKTFSELKSFVKIFTIRDADSMLLYCEEFLSGPALQTLKEAVKGCDIKQLHEMAKVVREASKKVGRALKEDELAAAVNNWRENGSITKAVQAVVDWIKLEMGNFIPKNKSALWGKEEYVTEKNLNIIKKHLSGDLSAEFNDAMISRLDAAYKNNIKINGPDLDFYKHELYESKMMSKGFSYNDAHTAAKEYYNAEEFNLYHPYVIKNNPQFFNSAWFEFWNIERN